MTHREPDHETERLDRLSWREKPHTAVILAVAAVSVLLLLGAGSHMLWTQSTDRQAKEEAEQTAEQLCDQIESMGRRCEVKPPPVQPERGEAGRGIAGVVAEGCSIRLRYTDATVETIGPLCGDDGSPGPRGSVGPSGPPGPGGVSITDAAVDGCDVVLTFSTGETRRLGPLCGPAGKDGRPGRSIIGVDCEGQGARSDWVFTFREPDGSVTEKTVDGPCRVSEPGSPSPRPPPIEGD